VKKAVLFLFVLLVSFFVLTPLVSASAVKTPVTGVMTVMLVDPGKVWITADGIEQVKGARGEGSITGDISGSITVIEDETIDLNTGLGWVHGKVVMTTADGTFEGHFVAVITDFYDIQGRAVAMGTGVYEGQKMMGSFVGHSVMVDDVPVTVSNVEGIILSPHG
jgi:hypothetical protein